LKIRRLPAVIKQGIGKCFFSKYLVKSYLILDQNKSIIDIKKQEYAEIKMMQN
jgi:hypothetical protein